MQWRSRQIFSRLLFACAHAGYLVIFTETGKNNYYHGRKVSNNYYKSLHKENVLAINGRRLLCRRCGTIKMLIKLDLNVR